MEGLKSVREGLEGEGELCRWDPEIIQILIRVSLVADSKASARNVGNLGSTPGSGRSPGAGNDNPLWYCCLENPMDGEAW